jgi:hypothetical protein
VYEAEDALVKGPSHHARYEGFSGTGFIDFGSGDQSVTWTVEAETAGEHEIVIRYALGDSRGRPLKLKVNDREVETLPFPSTGGWGSWEDLSQKVQLTQGENTITLEALDRSGANIDHLQLVE